MAEVLEITTKALDTPIQEEHSTYYYGNFIYVITNSSIYRIDIINNISTLLINKPSLGTEYYHTPMGVGSGEYIYYIDTNIYRNTYTFAIMRYSILDNIIEQIGTNVVNNSTYGGSYFVSSPRNIFINGEYINWVGSYSYTYGNQTTVGFYHYKYNIVTNTSDNHSCTSPRDSDTYNYLKELAYTTLQQTNPNGIFFYGGTTTYPNRWIFSTPIEANYNTYDGDLPFSNSATFWRGNDEVYILKSNSNILVFNTTTGILTTLSQSLPNIEYPFCTKVNDGYIILTNEGYIKISFVEYNLTYYIKSADGSHTYATHENSAPITKVLFGFDGENVSYIIKTLTENLYGSYTPIKIDNKILSGYSLYANSKKPTFNLNVDTDVFIKDNVTFYEVYSSYNPPERTFQINLYKNSAEANRVDKTDYLTLVGTLSGAMREESSITDMSITIESESVPNFNYVYIPIFNRYYYVTDITTVRYKLWEISLSVDVLMTYKDSIRKLKAFVDRNENVYNNNIIDKKRVIEQGYNVDEFTITNKLFDTGNSFVLSGFALKSNPITT